MKVSTLELGWKHLAGVSFLTWARDSRRLPPNLWDVVVAEGGGFVRVDDGSVVLLKLLKGCFSPFFGLHSTCRR